MAITFTVNDIVLDEQAGEHTLDDNDITFAAFNTAVGATVANYLGGLPHASGGDQTAFAQAAERTDFLALSSTTPVTDLSFAINSDGDPFPTTAGEGIDSGLKDIDGNTIYLFQGIDDVVIGVIGNDPTASVAFAIVLNETLTNGLVTGASLLVVQYEALFQDGINLVDSADILDLTNKLFVSASSQATATFSDFRDVPSGQTEFAMIAPDTAPPGQTGLVQILATGIAPNGSHTTVNVSTQGGFNGSLGVGNQGIAVGEALRIDVVTGGDVTISNPESHNAANIDFTDHREVNEASFGIVQTNPSNASVDALLTAYNVNEAEGTVDGAQFVTLAHDGTPDSKATITSVTVKDQNGNVIEHVSNDGNPANDILTSAVIITFNADNTVLINNLKDDYLVDFTTLNDMDRFVVKNVGSGNEQFDIGRLSVSSTIIVQDVQEIGSHVIFEDDGPSIDLTPTDATIAVDESVGTGGSSKDEPGNAAPDDETAADAPAGAIGFAVTAAATLFSETADAGSDGEASKVYELVLNAGATGLTDTATGEAVVLSLLNGVVEGRTETSDDLVFTIAFDAVSGDVTTTLYRALDHGDDSNDHDSSVSMASGLVELTATLTDGDTDSASDKIELGSLIGFEDDGPAIDLTPTDATIAVDESLGTGGSSKDEPGNAAPDDETAADAPAGAIGFAVTAAATLFSETADAGSDGEASKVYELVLNAGATGLTDTATGEAVVLSLLNGVVEGRTETSDDLVFTIAFDAVSGDVTTTLYRALDHGDDSNDHDSSVSMASGLVELTATLTDGDTDSASDKIELGSLIGFEDDGPAVTVNDANGTYAAGAAGTWDDDPGTDGFGSLGVTFDSYEIDTHGSVDTSPANSTFEQTGAFVFEGAITDDFNGDGTDDTVEFTLTFDPVSDSYDLQVTTPPETVVDFSTADGSVPAGGPDPVQTVTVGDIDIVFSAVEPDTLFAEIAANLNQPEAFIETNADYLTLMNVSTTGIGVGDNNLDGNAIIGIDGETTQGGKVDESFVVDPEGDVSSVKVLIAANGGPSYNPATEELFYLAYDENGNAVGTPTKVLLGDLTTEADGRLSFVIGDPEGPNNIDAVQLFMGTGTVKIPEIQFTVSTTFEAEPVQLDFTATLVDGDGDNQTDTFSVELNV